MQNGLNNFSLQTYDLRLLFAVIFAVIGVLVYVILIGSLIKYRNSDSTKVGHFHKNTMTEIIWTIIPILILAAMALPSIQSIS